MKKLCALIACAIIFAGCSDTNQKAFESNQNREKCNIPYASETELEELVSLNENYMDYKMLRTLAMFEMEEFNQQNYWASDAVLSDKPVIIWKNDSTPLYYEFYVIDDGEISGYITCNVDKRNGDPVTYVGLDKKDYGFDNESSSRDINVSSKIFAVDYPYCEVANSSRDLELLDERTDDEIFLEWVDSLSPEDFTESEGTKEELIAEYFTTKEEERIRLEKLWSLILEAKSELENLKDEEIIKAFSEDAESRSSVSVSFIGVEDDYDSTFTMIKPYCDYDGHTRRQTYCAPSVLEFIAQCYWNENGNKLSLDDIEKRVKDKMGDKTIKFDDSSWKPTLEYITDNGLSLHSYHGNHKYSIIRNDLIKNKQPVISCRSGGKSVFGVFAEGHVRCITGTCTLKHKVKKQFLWYKWSEWENTGYYYMWDNGHELKNKNNSSAPSGTGSTRKNGVRNHFWEKENSWFYLGIKCVYKK